ncbi:tRNA pseudouridine synthase D, putative [Plasmodium ovale wallikeri]|uniref:tRNA pseudouridine synthase D, putative n=1 Tax=Plasmodium ovale wallikeri TaxID=864142 RepID=A0A1A8YIZ0_PLAOA|nr:tRNA pseudouridine synthase D, putative [Plasmodium ovale wallikeri]
MFVTTYQCMHVARLGKHEYIMFLWKNPTKLLLQRSDNVTTPFGKKNSLLSNFRQFSSRYLSEEDVGIIHFMSDFLAENRKDKKVHENVRDDIQCIFKYKCEDFHVYEIEKNNNVLNVEYIKRKIAIGNTEKGENVNLTGGLGTHHESPGKGEVLPREGEQYRDGNERCNSGEEKHSKTTPNSVTESKGIPHRREEYDEDVTNNTEEETEWLKFILYKVNKDTQEAIREISKVSGIAIKDFHYSGFKDKRSVSTQVIATKSINWEKIQSVKNYYFNKKIKNILICNIVRVRKKVELGEHKGNHFIVVLRNVQNNEDYLRNRLRNIKQYGFINYFGMQRFGVYKNTSNKGKALISRDYKEYIKCVLDASIFEKKFFYGNVIKDSVTIYLKHACNLYFKKNATFAFRYFTCKMIKLLKLNDLIHSRDLSKDTELINKHMFSYMTNSEYEAFILLRNLYMCEKNNRRDKVGKNTPQKRNDKILKINAGRSGRNEDGEMNSANLREEENCKSWEKNEHNFYKNEQMCVKGVSMETRRFHMHSYSAKIFNMLTSYRLQNFGIFLTNGDYVFTKDIQSKKVEAKNQHNYITVFCDNSLTNVSMYNVVLPVLGSMPSRLSYLNVFKKMYRKYSGKNIRLAFLEILLYLICTLYEDNLFRVKGDQRMDSYISANFMQEKKGKKDSIKLVSQHILTNAIPIKETLYIIKKFDTYINTFDYEYGMTCMFRNVVILPKDLYFCFCKYSEPKAKFVSDLYTTNFFRSKPLNGKGIHKYIPGANMSYDVETKSSHANGGMNDVGGSCVETGGKPDRSHTVAEWVKIVDKHAHVQGDSQALLVHNVFHNRTEEQISRASLENGASSFGSRATDAKQCNALILSFNLNSSSYATMLVRELYGKRNELLVHKLIEKCQKYHERVAALRR